MRAGTSITARGRGGVVNSSPRRSPDESTGKRELTMTDNARQKLLDVDRRYRLIFGSLGIADLIADPAARKREPEVRRKYFATERQIDQLRPAHSNLLRKLEAQFWKVHPTAQATTGKPC
jgi:hypothetical protein